MSDAAWGYLLQIVITIAGFLTVWVKLKYGDKKVDKVEKKLDDNTHVTKTAAFKATNVAEVVDQVKEATDTLKKKMNGGIDSAISEAITPIQKTLEEHVVIDERNVKDVNDKLETLTEYVHKRNHEILNALQTQSNRIENIRLLMLEMTKEKK